MAEVVCPFGCREGVDWFWPCYIEELLQAFRNLSGFFLGVLTTGTSKARSDYSE
jgi:hypothetical protein